MGEKTASRESCPIRDKGANTSQILSHMRELGGGGGLQGAAEKKKEKTEDDSINQSMITAELFPDCLTSGPRTGGVFKTHYYLY